MPERRRDDPFKAFVVLMAVLSLAAFLTLWLLALRDKARAQADRTEWRAGE